jgi:hypothetical protein
MSIDFEQDRHAFDGDDKRGTCTRCGEAYTDTSHEGEYPYTKLETTGPMTLGEFRALTAELPESALMYHEYDGMLVTTRAVEVVTDLYWQDNDLPSSERKRILAPVAIITAADGYNLWGP